MQRYFIILMIGFSMLAFGCSKSVTNESDPIVFTIDAAASNITVASNFGVGIKIASRISSNGLKVELTGVEEISSVAVLPQAPAFITTTVDNSTSIINLPQQKWVVATVKITDVNNAKNSASKSFRVIYK